MSKCPDVTASARHARSRRGKSPRPRVLALTTFDLDEIVHDTLEAGADGFLLKRSTPDGQLIAGIRTVAAGDALISATLTRRLLGYVAAKKSGAAGASSWCRSPTERPRCCAT